MSTLEKVMILLQEMPEQSLETIYAFMQSLFAYGNQSEHSTETSLNTVEHVIPELTLSKDSVEKRRKGFQGLMSFAGTLPQDFDCKSLNKYNSFTIQQEISCKR